MTRRYVPLLLLLTGLWGSSFLFIEIALEEVEPTVVMAVRLLFAALVLVPALMIRSGAGGAFGGFARPGCHCSSSALSTPPCLSP